jgi:hypothetical protein
MSKKKTATAITLLKQDHEDVKAIFDDFEGHEGRKLKELALEAIQELKIHAKIEEELFYPALRKAGVESDLMEEADEEHHLAKMIIAELELMKGTEENYAAKCMVLAECVRHHIEEEEGEMFPKARKADVDLAALGAAMKARKEELVTATLEPEAEEKMIKKAGLIEVSPAKLNLRGFEFPSAGA